MPEYDDMSADENDEDLDSGSAQTPLRKKWTQWLAGKTGWLVIIVIALLQGVFATVMIIMKAGEKPVQSDPKAQIQALAVEMLGREVAIKQIYQLIPGPNGRRMTIGLDIVLVLGQLPEERIEGAPRPNDAEFDDFTFAISAMESRVRSRMNFLLQRIPFDQYGSPEVYETIKNDIKDYINDELEKLDFVNLRPGIGKRRVTDVFLPLFVRQVM